MKTIMLREFDSYDYKLKGKLVGVMDDNEILTEVEFITTRSGGLDITQFVLSPDQFVKLVETWKRQDFMEPPTVLFDDGDDKIEISLYFHPPSAMIMEVTIKGRHESNIKWRVTTTNKEQYTFDQMIELGGRTCDSNNTTV